MAGIFRFMELSLSKKEKYETTDFKSIENYQQRRQKVLWVYAAENSSGSQGRRR